MSDTRVHVSAVGIVQITQGRNTEKHLPDHKVRTSQREAAKKRLVEKLKGGAK